MRRPISIWILEAVLVFLVAIPLWYAISALLGPQSVMDSGNVLDRVRPVAASLALRLIVVSATLWSLHFNRKCARVLAPLAPLVLIVFPSLVNLFKLVSGTQAVSRIQTEPELAGAISFLVVAIGFATILSLRVLIGKKEKRFLRFGKSMEEV